ncbi:SLC13 family permease [Sulfidibacter corallicola]|uniref:SLC13 family permease n=1 Tax=Sulfidibacter corallicola TaxID=2818388 RepID=A0A8A4TJ49_SULCO|nr:SLC13 family permease [Sulfidibacter corallicola]QTD49946.1 SLC13 family permease [Sulfidibacter corallicola]
MSTDQILVVSILIVSLILFVIDKIRVDLVSMGVMVALVLTGLLSPEQAFSGFASPAVITVWGVFIVSAGLSRCGIDRLLAQGMLAIAGSHPLGLLTTLMLCAGLMSAFMNNVGAVAILLPTVMGLCRERGLPPSKMLIPVAFASLMGGNMTLIGTPPNILATDIMRQFPEVPGFSFFDFLPTGLIIMGTGLLYMLLIGRHLLPERQPALPETPTDPRNQSFLSEAVLTAEAPLVGKTLFGVQFGTRYGLSVRDIRRDKEYLSGPSGDANLGHIKLKQGDTLVFEGPLQVVMEACHKEQLDMQKEPSRSTKARLLGDDEHIQMAEITLSPTSRLIGQSLKQINFRQRFGLSVIAIRHQGSYQMAHLAENPLDFGDLLVVRGPRETVATLRSEPEFLLLEPTPITKRYWRKTWMAATIFGAAITAAALGILHISIAILLAALAMVATHILSMNDAYRAIDWKSVFLIAGMLPLGEAMEHTGTAMMAARAVEDILGHLGPWYILAGLFLITAGLTEIISNAAATVLMVPIAIDIGLALGVDPRGFVMATVIAASTSFLMPIGHQVNVLIYGPGGYRFGDFARVGFGLNLLLFIVVTFALPWIWPF